MCALADPNADVQIVSGDPSASDGAWIVEVDGIRIRVVTEGGIPTETSVITMFTGDPDRLLSLEATASDAVNDMIAYFDASKGFGYHPDVVA